MKKNVLLVATKTTGGAARACLMQLAALNESETFRAKLLVRYVPENPMDGVVGFEPTRSLSLLHRTKNRLWEEMRRYYSQFCSDGVHFPFGAFDITQSSAFQEADIVVFHWCYHFVDFSKLPRKGKKYFWVCHDMAPFNGGVPYEKHSQMNRLQRVQQWCLQKMIKQLDGLDIGFVFPSLWLMEEFGRSQLGALYPAHHLPYSCDFIGFQKQLKSCKRVRNRVSFLAADVNNPRKGFTLLSEALELIEEPLELLVIGRVQLEELKLPARHSVKAVGFVANPIEIAKWLASCHLFIMPSVEDNLPNTVLESLSVGTPVVGFKIGGMPDMVKDGKLGLLISNVSVDGMIRAIQLGLATEWCTEEIMEMARERYGHSTHNNEFLNVLSQPGLQ